MFAGHFAVAATVKATDSKTPLWALMLGTQLMDVLFVPMFLTGVETIEPVGTGYGEHIIHADYTHSLVGAALIAVIAGLLAWRFWSKRSGLTIGAVVFSHWLLDLLVHRMDMPIFPGNLGHLPLLGLGLWRSPTVSMVVEGLMIVAGAFLYIRSALSRATAAPTGQHKGRALTAGFVLGALLVFSLVVDVVGIG